MFFLLLPLCTIQLILVRLTKMSALPFLESDFHLVFKKLGIRYSTCKYCCRVPAGFLGSRLHNVASELSAVSS